uniref:Chromosome 1 open reading frame 198 n=1 Tax=Sphenodon punctatus TaxID=8508 RepID=A0A8D0L2K6_SPHPU
MASMAAAIAASRTAVMNGNRPLDERERKRFSYFSSLSPMARKIMAEKERIRERYGPDWERLPPRQQDEIVDKCLVEPHIQARYAAHRGASRAPPPPCYPSLRLNSGQKVVHFGDEDITWQDEHSAPFSWETKSQMEFSIASLAIQEQSGVPSQNEQRQPVKTAPVVQAPKSTQGGKTPSSDGLMPTRKEEESSFWKINAERSKFEGQQSEFQSLTPSQIKSMEKGEKTLPSYYRQESGPKDTSKAEKPSIPKQEKIVPPILATTSIEWEKSRHSQPACGGSNCPPRAAWGSGPLKIKYSYFVFFLQVKTSNVILKTGFDFLDNW